MREDGQFDFLACALGGLCLGPRGALKVKEGLTACLGNASVRTSQNKNQCVM
jgi:hypothetical protein